MRPLPTPEPVRKPTRTKAKRKRSTPPADLLEKARQIDREHRERTGRAVPRDELRRQLSVSTSRASELLKMLRESRAAA